MRLFAILAYLFVVAFSGSPENEKISALMSKGKQQLSRGQASAAIESFSDAIAIDSANYLAYLHRSTAYLILGKASAAVEDLTTVTRLKPDFAGSYIQRGGTYMKQGKFALAKQDFKKVTEMRSDSMADEARVKLELVEKLKVDFDNAKLEVKEERRCHDALDKLTHVLEHAIWFGEAFQLRVQCHKENGDRKKAVQDLKQVTRLFSDPTDIYLDISLLRYEDGYAEESLKEVRECLKLNADHKPCKKHYKHVKKVAKLVAKMSENVEAKSWDACVEQYESSLVAEPNVQGIIQSLKKIGCKCLMNAGRAQEALSTCNDFLENAPEDVDVLCDRAEAYLLIDEFDKASEDFHRARDLDEDSGRAKEGLKKVERLKKNRNKKDYYKILGVSKGASKREVLKAYRKLAHQWHPDNFQDDAEKKTAQNKFIDIAAAKEVLSDEEKRAKFDSGVDPLDPDSSSGGHHQGGHPFDSFFRGGADFEFFFRH